MAHTKGTWQSTEKLNEIEIWAPGTARIATVHLRHVSVNEWRANACLLLAAADMLLSLRQAAARVKLANSEGNPILSAWLPEAEAIIAKAGGAILPAAEPDATKDRAEALTTAFDALTAYLTDHCPDDCPWELFDGGVDEARMAISDAMEDYPPQRGTDNTQSLGRQS